MFIAIFIKVMFMIMLWPFQIMLVSEDTEGQLALVQAQPVMVIVTPECLPLPEG